jgi:D-alanyl-D-alanine carboxypeptidase (penicillin-binding protein 5/6)
MRGTARSFGRALLATALLVCSFVVALGQPVAAEGTPPPQAFVVVDAGTGAVLTSRNLHQALPPASTTKILTALVAIERLRPNATLSVSANAAGRESTVIGMKAGQKWPLDQALASMMMVSANDAAYAIAETVGGTLAGFKADLTSTAKRYGMVDSTFSDPAGLTDGTSYEGGPKMSAYDLAIATRNALTVPAIAQWADRRTYDFTDAGGTPQGLTNHNKFLPDNGFGYAGANGFKTGFTQIANHTLVATADRNGRQLIAVILGSVDSGYTWAASLLDAGFAKPRNTKGTGIKLPDVAVSPYGTRVAQRDGFVQLARGGNGATPLPTTTKPSAAQTPAINAPRKAPSSHNAAAAAAAATTTTVVAASKGGGGLLTLSHFLLVVVIVLFFAVLLRRRAVKRQRQRRIERQRARAKAMRSGSLPVVDGRYRTGTRLGPPVESQVRVQKGRGYIDLTKDEPIRSTTRGSRRRSR